MKGIQKVQKSLDFMYSQRRPLPYEQILTKHCTVIDMGNVIICATLSVHKLTGYEYTRVQKPLQVTTVLMKF